jgi:hypothetical protein
MNTQLTPESEEVLNALVAVHLTDHYPAGGVVKTRASATRSTKNYFPRHTVHWSLNHPVNKLGTHGWDNKKTAVIAPLNSLLRYDTNSLGTILSVDTFFVGDVTLPNDAIILSNDPAEVDVRNENYSHDGTLHAAVERVLDREGYAVMIGGDHGWGVAKNFSPKIAPAERELQQLARELEVRQGKHAYSAFGQYEEAVMPLFGTNVPLEDLQKGRVRLQRVIDEDFPGLPLTGIAEEAEGYLKQYDNQIKQAAHPERELMTVSVAPVENFFGE